MARDGLGLLFWRKMGPSARRNARRRGDLWEARASLRSEALDELEAQAEEHGRSGTRHRGMILEAWVLFTRGLTATERAHLDAALRNREALEGELLDQVLQILQRRRK
jgi:ribosomal protein S4